MFDPTSRYYNLGTGTYVSPDGQVITYVRRRFLPQGETMPLLVEVTVIQGDRLDLVATRTLGDPEQFWRICDANGAMRPDALTEEVGRTLRITLPDGIPGGRIV
jgi:hypothetical protein